MALRIDGRLAIALGGVRYLRDQAMRRAALSRVLGGSMVPALALLCQSCKVYDPTATSSVDSAGLVSSGTFVDTPSRGLGPRSCLPGQRMECRENEKGQPLPFPPGGPRGRCRYGERLCSADGSWGPCLGAVGPLPHDSCSVHGDDSNCNGESNDSCACVERPGQFRECGKSEGACEKGIQRCVDGSWGACEGETVASAEKCDGQGIDEDCDGLADLEDEDCECVDGTFEGCFVPRVKGDCSLGQKLCEGGKAGPCLAIRKPTVERCGVAELDPFNRATGDEDCDGLVDEEDGPEPPEGCKVYHLDQDADTWGALGPSYIEDPLNATHGCFCKSPPPELSALVLAMYPDRVNGDCGDCVEGGQLVKPTQSLFKSEASACLKSLNWPGGPYDYNCDGREELRFGAVHQGSCEPTVHEGGECRWAEGASGYWVDQVRPCGVDGMKPRCLAKEVAGKMTCVASEKGEHQKWTQRCR